MYVWQVQIYIVTFVSVYQTLVKCSRDSSGFCYDFLELKVFLDQYQMWVRYYQLRLVLILFHLVGTFRFVPFLYGVVMGTFVLIMNYFIRNKSDFFELTDIVNKWQQNQYDFGSKRFI